MSLRDMWDRWLWLLAIAVLATFVAVMIFGRAAFCTVNEEHCVRDWIAALSGWAAACAATATIIVLVAHLKTMSDQRDFALGFAEPSLSLHRDSQNIIYADISVKLINWNRHALNIEAIRISSDGRALRGDLTSAHINGRLEPTLEIYDNGVLGMSVGVDGWDDRSARPANATFVISISDPEAVKGMVHRVQIQVVGFVFAEQERRFFTAASIDTYVKARTISWT